MTFPTAIQSRPARANPKWALFLDVDGTLLDIAPHPDLVRVPEGLVVLLQGIDRALGGAVALVSGRPLTRLDELLSPWRPAAAGEHGAYLRLPNGEVISPPVPARVPDRLLHGLRMLTVEHSGVMVEEKKSAVTVHFRLAPGEGAAICSRVEALVAEGGGDFAAIPARKAIEVRPRGADKGWAVRRLMREAPFTGRVPVFVGDDVTDEDGFRAAEEAGGIGLHVRAHFPEGAATVRAWLTDMLRQLDA